jgi:hypothetical protein
VQGAGFTDSANKGIRSESQSTPVIRLAPSLPLTGFPRAFDCPDPSPDRQGGARGSAEVSGLALSLLRRPDGSHPQPLRATLSRSAVAGSGCRNPASGATVSMRESAMLASNIHRAATGNGAAESKTHNPPRREPTGDRLCGRRRARLAPVAQTGHAGQRRHLAPNDSLGSLAGFRLPRPSSASTIGLGVVASDMERSSAIWSAIACLICFPIVTPTVLRAG